MKNTYLKQTLLALSISAISQLGYADVPGTTTYQGRVLDNSNNPVNGTISITFSIPNTSWTETHTGVQVNQGSFGVILGSKTSLIDVDLNQPRSLRIEYDGSSQTVPLTSVVSSLIAQKVVEETLGKLNCSTDQIAKYNGTAWECASPSAGGVGSGSNGSVFIRWGNGTAPTGTTLLYSGFAFNEHYTQVGGSAEPTCIKAGDVGAPGSGSYYGDLLYPVGTGSATRMPPGISPKTEIKCAVVYSESPTFEMWGSQSCPTGWSAAYTGYGMGGYYGHAHQLNRKCVDNVEYDYSVANPNWGGIFYGTVLHKNTNVGIYETNRYVKCAICAKD